MLLIERTKNKSTAITFNGPFGNPKDKEISGVISHILTLNQPISIDVGIDLASILI